jgi:dienelactone hydrolase
LHGPPDRERIGAIGMCGSGAMSLSAAQIDRHIKAVATVDTYDHHRLYDDGFRNSLAGVRWCPLSRNPPGPRQSAGSG